MDQIRSYHSVSARKKRIYEKGCTKGQASSERKAAGKSRRIKYFLREEKLSPQGMEEKR